MWLAEGPASPCLLSSTSRNLHTPRLVWSVGKFAPPQKNSARLNAIQALLQKSYRKASTFAAWNPTLIQTPHNPSSTLAGKNPTGNTMDHHTTTPLAASAWNFEIATNQSWTISCIRRFSSLIACRDHRITVEATTKGLAIENCLADQFQKQYQVKSGCVATKTCLRNPHRTWRKLLQLCLQLGLLIDVAARLCPRLSLEGFHFSLLLIVVASSRSKTSRRSNRWEKESLVQYSWSDIDKLASWPLSRSSRSGR